MSLLSIVASNHDSVTAMTSKCDSSAPTSFTLFRRLRMFVWMNERLDVCAGPGFVSMSPDSQIQIQIQIVYFGT